MAKSKKRREPRKPDYRAIDIGPIDWGLLRKQKEWLGKVSVQHWEETGKYHPRAEGLLSFLDHFMDEAEVHLGTEKVFGKKMAKLLGPDSVEV